MCHNRAIYGAFCIARDFLVRTAAKAETKPQPRADPDQSWLISGKPLTRLDISDLRHFRQSPFRLSGVVSSAV
jgi:hypothetical protein